jgi:molybdopterin-guanine dinucleotide biosynthesis protein A
MISNISGVILAGGANKRFNGITKANIVIDGRTIISRIIDTISDIFEETIIVTNTPEEFTEYNHLKIVGDIFLKAGPLGGIHAAIRASESKALFVFAGDMPLINKDIIIRQIDYFNTNIYDVLVPQISDNIEPLHAIYSCSVKKDLEEYLHHGQNYAVRDFLDRVNSGYLIFDESIETRNAFTNVNTPSDLDIIEEILRNYRI